MRTLSALALFFALAVAATAQRAANNTDEQLKARNAPDLFVYGASAFGPDKNGDSNFTIEVGNTGAKTITTIEWEYYSPRNDTGDGAISESFRDEKLKLLPEKRTKLTQKVHRYTNSLVAGFGLATVRITRVEYEDGSSWRRPAELK
jgi:hypothetical protein